MESMTTLDCCSKDDKSKEELARWIQQQIDAEILKIKNNPMGPGIVIPIKVNN